MTLMVGSKGSAVRALQEMLSGLGNFGGEATGVYDTETVEAVKRFQAKERLWVTGKADAQTQMILAMRDSVVVSMPANPTT